MRVVLVCERPAKKRHHAVAEVARDVPTVSANRSAASLPVHLRKGLQVFRVESFCQLSRSDQITKHNGDVAELWIALLNGRLVGTIYPDLNGRLGCKRGNGFQQLFAVPKGDAKLFEIALRQIRKYRFVDVILFEQGGVLVEAVPAQPLREIATDCRHRRPLFPRDRSARTGSICACSVGTKY